MIPTMMREEMKVYYFTCSGNVYLFSVRDRYLKKQKHSTSREIFNEDHMASNTLLLKQSFAYNKQECKIIFFAT